MNRGSVFACRSVFTIVEQARPTGQLTIPRYLTEFHDSMGYDSPASPCQKAIAAVERQGEAVSAGRIWL